LKIVHEVQSKYNRVELECEAHLEQWYPTTSALIQSIFTEVPTM